MRCEASRLATIGLTLLASVCLGVSTAFATDVPKGGVKIPTPTGVSSVEIDVKNATGKDAYDITVSYLEDNTGTLKAGGDVATYADNGETDNDKKTRRASMDTLVTMQPNNPIKMKVGDTKGTNDGDRRLGSGDTITVTITLTPATDANDEIEVSLSTIGGATILASLTETEPNNTVAQALDLGGGDYPSGSVSSASDVDLYSFLAADDDAFVSLSLSGVASNTKIRLLDTDGSTVLAQATGSGTLSISDFGLDYGTHYVEVTNLSGATSYSLSQSLAYVDQIPTLSEWGGIVMLLLLATAGTIVWSRRSVHALAGAGGAMASEPPLLVPALLARVLMAEMLLVLVGFALAVWLDGGLEARDVGGTLVCATIAGYLVHLWLAIARQDD